MLKNASSKAMWVAKGMAIFWGAVLTLALLFGVATTALADNGGNWILGKFSNTATKITGLTANVPNGQAALAVANSSNGPAVALRTTDGQAAPIRTNSDGRVTNLNSDLLDGNNAGAFLGSSTVIRTENNDLGNGTNAAGDTAICEDGEVATGGGGAIVLDGAPEGQTPVADQFDIVASRPVSLSDGANGPPNAWQISIFAKDGASNTERFTLRVYAVCTNVGATVTPTPLAP